MSHIPPQNLTVAFLCPHVGKAGASEPSTPAEAAEGSPDPSSVLLAAGEDFPPGKVLPSASPISPAT